MGEVWLPVVGFEGLYEVSDLVQVRSLSRTVSGLGREVVKRGRVLTPCVASNGYLMVSLSKEGKRANGYVHRLVLEAHVGPSLGLYACHSDGDRLNNTAVNLRWDTPSENARDSVRHGSHSETRKTECAKGHPYTPENTGIRATGRRWCRACNREAMSARRDERTAA